MGCALQNKKDFDGAAKCFKESFEVRRIILGEESIEVGDTLNMVGFNHFKQNNLDDAKGTLWQALKIRKMNNDNIKIAETLKNIGDVHKQEEEFHLATQCYDECLRLRRHKLGSHCEEVAEVLIARGTTQKDNQNNKEAKQFYEEALTIRIQLYSESDDRVAEVLFLMGN